jgi:hypothetical protein
MKGVLLRLLSLSAILVALSCGDGAEGGSLSEISGTRQCRANLNTLCTEMAVYRDQHGEWAASPGQLDSVSGRARPLACPESGLEYIITTDDEGGYLIECPSGHGSILTGRRSWCEGGGT